MMAVMVLVIQVFWAAVFILAAALVVAKIYDTAVKLRDIRTRRRKH